MNHCENSLKPLLPGLFLSFFIEQGPFSSFVGCTLKYFSAHLVNLSWVYKPLVLRDGYSGVIDDTKP